MRCGGASHRQAVAGSRQVVLVGSGDDRQHAGSAGAAGVAGARRGRPAVMAAGIEKLGGES